MSEKKLQSSLKNLEKAHAKNISKIVDVWKCQLCKIEKPATVHQKRKKYCSNKCVSKIYKNTLIGINNPNYKNGGEKICSICKKKYKNYNKTTKFCSMECRNIHGLSKEMRNNAKKDNNHNLIVELLEKGGVIVKDMSKAMNGFPDLLVWYFDAWHLIEIKNPDTYYGKKGLNKLQMKFAQDWKGGPVYIVRTKNDVNSFLIGEFANIEKVQGNA